MERGDGTPQLVRVRQGYKPVDLTRGIILSINSKAQEKRSNRRPSFPSLQAKE
jgi:hypothetical protein